MNEVEFQIKEPIIVKQATAIITTWLKSIMPSEHLDEYIGYIDFSVMDSDIYDPEDTDQVSLCTISAYNCNYDKVEQKIVVFKDIFPAMVSYDPVEDKFDFDNGECCDSCLDATTDLTYTEDNIVTRLEFELP